MRGRVPDFPENSTTFTSSRIRGNLCAVVEPGCESMSQTGAEGHSLQGTNDAGMQTNINALITMTEGGTAINPACLFLEQNCLSDPWVLIASPYSGCEQPVDKA
jgi:hypothetical protein